MDCTRVTLIIGLLWLSTAASGQQADCICLENDGSVTAHTNNSQFLIIPAPGQDVVVTGGSCSTVITTCPANAQGTSHFLTGPVKLHLDGVITNIYGGVELHGNRLPYSALGPTREGTGSTVCPAGFSYVGRLESRAHEVKETKHIRIPFQMSTTYQQPSLAGKGGDATSRLASQPVPRGVHIIAGGDVLGYGWAVMDPVLNGDDFSMHLYCSPGSDVLHELSTCGVYVEVCALPATTGETMNGSNSRHGLDLLGYCKKLGYTGVTNINGTGYGWRCTPGNVGIDARQVCKEQYGAEFPHLSSPPPGGAYDWYCSAQQ